MRMGPVHVLAREQESRHTRKTYEQMKSSQHSNLPINLRPLLHKFHRLDFHALGQRLRIG